MQFHTMVIGPRPAPDSGPPAQIALAGADGRVAMVQRPEFVDTLDQAVEVAVTGCSADPVQLVGTWAPGPAELEVAQDHGWRVAGSPLTGWYRLQRGGRVVLLGRLEEIKERPVELFCHTWSAEQIAGQLAAYRRRTGEPFWGTPGLSGVSIIRGSRHRRTPLWRWDEFPSHLDQAYAGELRWQAPEPLAAPGEYVHKFDVRGSYLAAMGQVKLSPDVPEPTGAIAFDPTRHGYWRVRVDPGYRPLLLGEPTADYPTVAPPMIDPRRVERVHHPEGGEIDTVWITTPIMAYLWETEDITPPVLDSVTAPGAVRLLYATYERLRDALASTEPAPDPERLTGALKDTYRHAVGMLGRPGGRIFRPDWRHALVDQARVMLWRRLDRMWWEHSAGWPLRIWVDSAEYAGDQDPGKLVELFGCGDRIGQPRHVATTPYAGWRDQHYGTAAAAVDETG